MDDLISVIIPVFNVEKYVNRALTSVVSQSYIFLEIIIVNDCSEDSSIRIIDEIVKKDDRIKIVNHEKNMGLGAARNTGINNANGKYIFFLDSDDWLEKDAIKTLYNVAKETDSEIVECGSRLIYENGESKEFLSSKFIDLNNIKALELLCEHKLGFMAWDKLYLLSFIKDNKLQFPNIYHEDINFSIQAMYLSNKITVIPFIFYNYFQRNTSISNTNISEKHLDSYFEVIDNICTFLNNSNLEAQLKDKIMKCIINWLLDNLLRYRFSGNKEQKLIEIINNKYKNGLFIYKLLDLIIENIIFQRSQQNEINRKSKLNYLINKIRGK